MLNIFCAPSRYVQGRDASAALGAQLTLLGVRGPVLIIASQRIQDRLETIWDVSLTQAGIEFVTHTFAGECSRSEIARGVSSGRTGNVTTVIGAGGGKALDAARAVAGELGVPAVNCPSLASSDAPCSALSVVYTDDGEFEEYVFYPTNPLLVLVDSTLVAEAPSRYLVAGMGDALATWFEARTVIAARKTNQVAGGATKSAEALARLCRDILFADGWAAKQAVEVNSVTTALERVIEANTLLSGLGFESGGLAIAHSVHNGLTTLPQTHSYLHGEKVAFGLIVQLVVEGQPSEEVDEVIRFCRSVGLPTTLTELGIGSISEGDLMSIADRAVAPGETAHNEPFVVTAQVIRDGIVAADRWSQSLD